MLKTKLLPLDLTGGKNVRKIELLSALRELFSRLKDLDLLKELSVIELPAGYCINKHRHDGEFAAWGGDV